MNGFCVNSRRTCRRCGKQLEYVVCGACGGKGYNRVWRFFKRECRACVGIGKVLRCPDHYRHLTEFLNVPLERWPQVDHRTISKPPAPPQVPPPWDPRFPNPFHPMNPLNPRNQPFNPQNPNSPTNPNNPRNPNNPMNPMNPNNPMKRKPFK